MLVLSDSAHAKRHTVLDNCDVTRLEAAATAVIGLDNTLEADGCERAAPLIRTIALAPNALTIDLDPKAIADGTSLQVSSLNAGLYKISTPLTCKRRGVRRASLPATLFRSLTRR